MKLKDSARAILVAVLTGFLAIAGILLLETARADGSVRVCIFYDQIPTNPSYKLGQVYAIMFENLLGHFSEVQTKEFTIGSYREGQLASCDRSAYIGSHYDAPISVEFLKDVVLSDRPFLWINYGIWKLQSHLGVAEFEKRFGFRFLRLESYSPLPTDEDNDAQIEPGFFKHFRYKGEVFDKFVRYDHTKKAFAVSPEISLIQVRDAKILAEAEHNRTKKRAPYIVRQGSFFYVADVPFSFIHEQDRYLIFSDLLFDFLKLPPRWKKKIAFVRIEDLQPMMSPELVSRMVGVFKNRKIPFGMTVIPRYVDIWGLWDGRNHDIDLLHAPLFVKSLKRAIAAGGRVMFHGYTHQSGHGVNCDSGASGDDFEFWDDCTHAPMPWDSPEYVHGRLAKGLDIFRRAGIPLYAWVPPHYQASPLAYKIFAQTFKRTMQRVRYIPDGVDPADPINWAGQFFPYVIEKDYYGQYILPENLGNVRHAVNEDPKDFNTQSAESIVAAARKNLVIRDAWGSFFFHPFLADDHLIRLESLEWILDEMLKMGYEFADLKDYADPF